MSYERMLETVAKVLLESQKQMKIAQSLVRDIFYQ
jgi:hypothetical protein